MKSLGWVDGECFIESIRSRRYELELAGFFSIEPSPKFRILRDALLDELSDRCRELLTLHASP